MTDEEHIEQLVSAPLEVPLSLRQRLLVKWRQWLLRWERYWPVVQKITAVTAVIALFVACVGIALVVQLALCTNNNLGARNAPNTADRQALALLFSDKPHGLLKALSDIGAAGADATARTAGFLELGDAFRTYNATVTVDNEIRADNPIGKC